MRISCIEVSVIIPTYNRLSVLKHTLYSLAQQTVKPSLFEVIVVSDGSLDDTVGAVEELARRYSYSLRVIAKEQSGPAATRNMGAREARGGWLVFIGDDTPLAQDFVFQHLLARRKLLPVHRCAVQGLTLWHPDIPPDDFHFFLANTEQPCSGLQANWPVLRDEKGNWRREAPGWFLTTNVAIDRETFFWPGGFNEAFPYAAWEDIEFAIRLQRMGIPTFFVPEARNFHLHRQTLEGFVTRQVQEGISRLTLVALHPEAAGDMIDSEGLRGYSEAALEDALRLARELHDHRGPELLEVRFRRWIRLFNLATMKGKLQEIRRRGGPWLALVHVHTADLRRYVAGCAAAYDRGSLVEAQMYAQWALMANHDNHALLAMSADVQLALGNREEAGALYQAALARGPGNEHVKEMLAGLGDR